MTPGGTVDYTITVVNDGETTYPSASFSDSLDQVLTDATYNGDATADRRHRSRYAAPCCRWTGALDPGDSASDHATRSPCATPTRATSG